MNSVFNEISISAILNICSEFGDKVSILFFL